MGAKARCSQCKNYYLRDEMLHTGLGGLGGICDEECYEAFLQKRRDKRTRRRIHRERKFGNGGRRLPGTCRDRVRRRDKGRCRWCFTTDDLQIHHVRYRSEGGPDTPKNLITLCAECHARAHSDKRKYQHVLLLWLWLFYVQEQEVTVPMAFRVARKHPEWVDDARTFSNGVMAEAKAREDERDEEEAA